MNQLKKKVEKEELLRNGVGVRWEWRVGMGNGRKEKEERVNVKEAITNSPTHYLTSLPLLFST